MKFKTEKELKKPDGDYDGTAFNTGLNVAFTSFSERVKFYKKYRVYDSATKDTTGVTKFRKDFPEIYANADFKKESWWNRWLFDYCFGDVINEM